MYYSKVRIIIFFKVTPCPFESFKKILYGLVRSAIFVNIKPS
jgi:hypothetical protein